MKVIYEIELEDFFVFSDHLIKTSTVMSRAIRKGQMWWASGPIVGGLVLSIFKRYSSEDTLMILAILSVAISLPMFFLYPYYFRYQNKKQITKLHDKGSYEGVLGRHEMTITDEHLIDHSTNNLSKIQWSSIVGVETLAAHTFVYTGDVTAYIIPHNKLSEGNVAQFVSALNEVLKNKQEGV